MCLLIYKPEGVRVPDTHLERAAMRHPHGFGIAFPRGGGRLRLWRTIADVAGWRRLASRLVAEPAIIHARYATHGPKVKANVHPVWIEPERSVLGHNGVLYDLPECPDGRSDTRVFVDHVVRWLAPGWTRDAVLVAQLERYMTAANKMVVLDGDGAVRILNESAGEWADGVWYSNDTFKAYPTYGRRWTGMYDGMREAPVATAAPPLTLPLLPAGAPSETRAAWDDDLPPTTGGVRAYVHRYADATVCAACYANEVDTYHLRDAFMPREVQADATTLCDYCGEPVAMPLWAEPASR